MSVVRMLIAGKRNRLPTPSFALLGQQLAGGEVKDLVAQLPGTLQDVLLSTPAAGSFGVQEFLHRLAEALPATETTRWDASAVLATVAEAITGGQLNQLLSQLQSGYAELFGKPDLA